MTNGSRPNFTPHLVVGFSLIFLGAVLALDRMGILDAARSLQYWPIALILVGGAMVAQAFLGGGQQRETSAQSFPVGPGIMVLVLVLAFARPFRSHDDRAEAADHPRLVAILGGDNRTSVATPFRGANMTAVMGGTVLDLRKATMPPGEAAVVDVFTLMGGSVVRVPADWRVDLQVTPVMGGVNDERRRPATDIVPSDDAPAPPRLVLKGFVMMGGIVLRN